MRPPPTATLFPYTTLFRSWANRVAVGKRSVSRGIAATSARRRCIGNHLQRRRALVAADRKSTRLNSSHEWISYAVFCLKKKNKAQRDAHGDLHAARAVTVI